MCAVRSTELKIWQIVGKNYTKIPSGLTELPTGLRDRVKIVRSFIRYIHVL